MFLELLATIFAGVAAAGVALALNRLSGRRLPGWSMPVAAAAAMIAMTIWSEYNWFDRTVAGMPEGLQIAEVNEVRQLYRPWTYAAPLVNRFVAVDVARMQSRADMPEQRIVQVYFWGRWQPVRTFPVVVDCSANKRAPLVEDVVFASDGSVEGAAWMTVPEEDPVLATACKEE